MMLADAPAKLAAHDLVEMLRRHYLPAGRPAGGVFAAEIEAPGGERRADAIWAPWSIAGGSGLVGHEVKVSRSDVLNELADPMKADPWSRFCHRWWLVVAHPSLVAGLTIPEPWGIMSPPSGRRTRSMTVVRQAPLLKPAETGPAWRRIAAWSDYRVASRIREAEYKAERYKNDVERLEREQLNASLADRGRSDPRAALVAQILVALDTRGRTGIRADEAIVDDIVAAILDVRAHRRLAERLGREIKWAADEARRLTEPAKHIAEQLDALAKKGGPA